VKSIVDIIYLNRSANGWFSIGSQCHYVTCINNRIKIVKNFCSINVNIKQCTNYTCLYDHIDIVKYYCDNHIDIVKYYCDNHIDIVKYYCDNHSSSLDFHEMIRMTCINDHVDTLDYIIITIQYTKAMTLACHHNASKIVNYLLKRDIDLTKIPFVHQKRINISYYRVRKEINKQLNNYMHKVLINITIDYLIDNKMKKLKNIDNRMKKLKNIDSNISFTYIPGLLHLSHLKNEGYLNCQPKIKKFGCLFLKCVRCIKY
jgi:hypothetical protein